METLIIGAGAAGLNCAYELEKAGRTATILEAQDRVGGRCLTVRSGDVLDEVGQPSQSCTFHDGAYLNPGPARLPQWHSSVALCRELGVPLEPFVNRNALGLMHSDAGPWADRRVRVRDLDHDLRGRAFELLASGLKSGRIGCELDASTREHLQRYLVSSAPLDADSGVYTGADRRSPDVPLPELRELLAAGLDWKLPFFEELAMQPTMLQVVGGTDRLTDALAGAVAGPVRTGCPVRRIELGDDGVRVVLDDDEIVAERCVVTAALPALRKIETNLPPAFHRAAEGIAYEPAVKVGLETNSRWWEEEFSLYGGMTFTDLPAMQVWYPSSGFGSRGSVLLGAYNFLQHGAAYSDRSPDERVDATVADVERIHGRPADVRSGISVAWRNRPYTHGAFATSDASLSSVLREPHPRLRLAGEHMGALHGWIAGALESGRDAARWILGTR